MNTEVNEIAEFYPPEFKRLVSFLYHFEPLAECEKFITAISPSLTDQLEAIENAQYCVEVLRDEGADYDAVDSWSTAQ